MGTAAFQLSTLTTNSVKAPPADHPYAMCAVLYRLLLSLINVSRIALYIRNICGVESRPYVHLEFAVIIIICIVPTFAGNGYDTIVFGHHEVNKLPGLNIGHHIQCVATTSMERSKPPLLILFFGGIQEYIFIFLSSFDRYFT